MSIPAQTFAQFVNQMIASWGASIGITPSFQSGDVLLAIFQAVASQDIFLQAQAQIVNLVARAQTSSGADLDTFMAQFGFPRLPATVASGNETFTAPNPVTSAVLVYPGTTVQTPGGAIQYTVIADATQDTWNAGLGAYVLATGQTSMMVTIQAVAPGANYNVAPGQLTQLTTSLPGISSVTNGSSIGNGINAESDANFLARFVLWLNSLSKATQNAILTAVISVQQGIMVNLIENVNVSDVPTLGQFVAIIDDGSGDPPTSLITAVQAGINVVRGFTILGTALAVTPEDPDVVIAVQVASGYSAPAVEDAVKAAIAALKPAIGAPLYINAAPSTGATGVENTALTVPGVISVQPGTTINAAAADYTVSGFQAVRLTTGNISVGTYD